MHRMSFLAAAALFGTSLRAEDLFIEAESSADHSFNEAARFEKIVSGDQILRLWKDAAPPGEGYHATFPFAVNKAGEFHLWLAPSLPPLTSNFWWRLDAGDWSHFTPECVEEPVARFGVSNAMGWVLLASPALAAGKHTLAVRVNERRNNAERAYLLYLDAILVTDRDVYPQRLVTPGDVARLAPRPPPPKPVERAGKPGDPMELGTSVMDDRRNRLVKSLGFCCIQTDSDHLTVNEVEPGKWDWTSADAGLAAARRAGLKWQYFPHFNWPPEWYRKGEKFVPSIGLRSKRKLACMSLWSPDIVPWFEHGYAALAEHYGSGSDPMYAIYLGIHGDFGETMFPMGFHPGERTRFGPEGTGLADYWCGDDAARADFRRFARQKYGSPEKLNAAWGTQFASFDALDYPPAAYGKGPVAGSAQSRWYWLDFVGWYYDSMTAFTGEVCRIARKHFPQSLLLLPVGGGNESLVYGQDTTAIPRVAKKHGVHIRSTHGGFQPFAQGYPAMIKRIATPCKVYGVPHWLEPPSAISAEGEVSRIMEAISCGNYGFWDWGQNPVNAAWVFRQYASFLTRETPVVDVALFFPTTHHRLRQGENYPRQLAEMGAALRDVMDYDVVDEELIADDGLKGYRVLVWLEGDFVEHDTLDRIARWLGDGGVLVRFGAQDVRDVEGETKLGRELLGLPPQAQLRTLAEPAAADRITAKEPGFLSHVAAYQDRRVATAVTDLDPKARPLLVAGDLPAAWAMPHGKGWAIAWAGGGSPPQARQTFYELLRDVVYNLSKLDPSKADAQEVDTAWDGVYATLLANGEVILHNLASEERTKKVGSATIALPPKSLRSILFRTR
ncbi:MAG TPA: family 14 glycosylhydrolase [Planctomycetota bacterium]|nr:family 14 glycosylhydrolase [Planctomycetota bacterium]